MQRAKFVLNLPGNPIQIEVEADNQRDLLEQIARWQELDVPPPREVEYARVSFRQPKNKSGVKCPYYSFIDREAGYEFQLGILTGDKREVFPKGWVKLPPEYLHAEKYEEAEEELQPPPPEPTGHDDMNSVSADEIDWGNGRKSEPKTAPKPGPRPVPKPAPNMPSTYIGSKAERIEEARQMLASNRVAHDAPNKRFVVTEEEDLKFYVTRDETGEITCNCPDLRIILQKDEDDRCAHIFAVQLLHQQKRERKA
jgi:hypothetical protein